jgi:hypothetical protein
LRRWADHYGSGAVDREIGVAGRRVRSQPNELVERQAPIGNHRYLGQVRIRVDRAARRRDELHQRIIPVGRKLHRFGLGWGSLDA